MYKHGQSERATRATPVQAAQYHRGRRSSDLFPWEKWRHPLAEASQTALKFRSDRSAAALSFQSAGTMSGVVIKRDFQMFKGSNQRREAF